MFVTGGGGARRFLVTLAREVSEEAGLMGDISGREGRQPVEEVGRQAMEECNMELLGGSREEVEPRPGGLGATFFFRLTGA